jgi:hypothetical protein
MNPKTLLPLLLLFLLPTFACSGLTLPSSTDAESAMATAQAMANQSAPTFEAMMQEASNLATQSAPTIEAAMTQGAILATQSAPTIEAAMTQAGTIAAEAQARGANAQATLQAAGIDGEYLNRKAQSLRPDANGNVTLTLTETELNLLLQWRQLFAASEPSGEPAPVQDGQVSLQNGQILFAGDLLQPLAGRVEIGFVPTVVQGQLGLTVVSAQVGNTAVPPFILTSITDSLTGIINPALAQLPNGIILKQITVSDGTLTLIAGPQ